MIFKFSLSWPITRPMCYGRAMFYACAFVVCECVGFYAIWEKLT